MRLSIIFLSIILFSCYSEKKATKQINKAIDKKPVLSAELFRKKFPCESIDTVVRIDTAWDYVEFECPDKPAQIKTDTLFIQKNVIKKQILQGKSVVVAGKTEYKTITIKVKDSAEIFILNNTINEFSIKEQKLNSKIENRNKFILWLLIALIISILLHLIRRK
jgi:hypothetical protein